MTNAIKTIRIEFSEGTIEVGEMVQGRDFKSPEGWAAAHAALQADAPEGGAYTKTFIVVTYANGETKTGRIDITRSSANPFPKSTWGE
jgi:hypothetical protein